MSLQVNGDHGLRGEYRISRTIALLVTQTANGVLFSMRWGDPTYLCLIEKLKMTLIQETPATATISSRVRAFVARGFTASDSAGSQVSIAGNNLKKRTADPVSLITDMRVSADLNGVTAGTRTLDTDSFLTLWGIQQITTVNPILYSSEMDASQSEIPLILSKDEGIVITGPSTVFGAAGTASLVVDINWKEALAF